MGDLLFPTVGELVGGSLREHRFDVLEAACKRQLGEQDKGMDWYLAMRKAGSSPTGGFGMGFERLVQFVIGCWNIRDTAPFSRKIQAAVNRKTSQCHIKLIELLFAFSGYVS